MLIILGWITKLITCKLLFANAAQLCAEVAYIT